MSDSQKLSPSAQSEPGSPQLQRAHSSPVSKPPLTPEQSCEHRGSQDFRESSPLHVTQRAAARQLKLSKHRGSAAEDLEVQVQAPMQDGHAFDDAPDLLPPVSAFSAQPQSGSPTISLHMKVQPGDAEDGRGTSNPVECHLCEVKVQNEFVDEHIRGQRHSRRLRQEALLQEQAQSCQAAVESLLGADLDAADAAQDSPSRVQQGAGQGDLGGKNVRFGGAELVASDTGGEPPMSVFDTSGPMEPPATVFGAVSSAPPEPPRTVFGSATPPPLWRGASTLAAGGQPLHGGGSFSLAVPHFCPICGIIATSEANLQDHLRGRRHARRLQYLRHMPAAERAKHIDRIASGEMLMGGRSSLGGSQDRAGMASLGSLHLPSSMDIALYLEQVQEVEPALASPHGQRRRLSQRFSASSSATPAIPEDGAEDEAHAAQDLHEDREPGEELPRSPPQVFHCDTCGIDTTSAAHLEAHMAGRKHRRRADIAEGKVTRRSPHICRLCDITATSADHLALHIAGRAHQRRARAAEDAPQDGAGGPSRPGFTQGFARDEHGRLDAGLRAGSLGPPDSETGSFTGSVPRGDASVHSRQTSSRSHDLASTLRPSGLDASSRAGSLPRQDGPYTRPPGRPHDWGGLGHAAGQRAFPAGPPGHASGAMHSAHPAWSPSRPHADAGAFPGMTPMARPGMAPPGMLHGLPHQHPGMLPGFYPQPTFYAGHAGLPGNMVQQAFMPQPWWPQQAAPPGLVPQPGMHALAAGPRDRMGTPRSSRERVDLSPRPVLQSMPYNCQTCDVQLDSMDKYKSHVKGTYHNHRRTATSRQQH